MFDLFNFFGKFIYSNAYCVGHYRVPISYLCLFAIFAYLINSFCLLIKGKFYSRKLASIQTLLVGLLGSQAIMIVNKNLTTNTDMYDSIPVIILNLKWFEVSGVLITFSFTVDNLTVLMISLVNIISLVVHIFAIDYMRQDPHFIRFLAYLSLFTFFMLFLVSSSNLVQFFLGWEGVGVCSYLLINFWFTRIEANKSALKALLMNRIGDFFLFMGICLIFFLFRSFDIIFIQNYEIMLFIWEQEVLNASTAFLGINRLELAILCFFIGAVGKSAQIGLHTWLPDAMEGPTPVSALLHAATMVTAGVFLIIRCSFLFEFNYAIFFFINVVGLTTIIFAGLVATGQFDIKKVIAYSTCSQLGYMIMCCGIHQYIMAFFHLITHAFFKALLFLVAGATIHLLNGEQDVRRMGSLNFFAYYPAVTMFTGTLALVGFPFTAGYYSKDIILELSSNITGNFQYAYPSFVLPDILSSYVNLDWSLSLFTFFLNLQFFDLWYSSLISFINKHINNSLNDFGHNFIWLNATLDYSSYNFETVVSKFAVQWSASNSDVITYFIALMGAFITSFYSFKMFYQIFLDSSRIEYFKLDLLHISNRWVRFCIIILFFGSLFAGYSLKDFFIGFGNNFFIDVVASFNKMSIEDTHFTISAVIKLLPFLMFLLGVSCFYFFYFSNLKGGALGLSKFIRNKKIPLYSLSSHNFKLFSLFFKTPPTLLSLKQKNSEVNSCHPTPIIRHVNGFYNKFTGYKFFDKKNVIIQSCQTAAFSAALRINSWALFVFNKRFFFDGVYNKYLTEKILKIGYNVTYVLFDKGFIEYCGPQFSAHILVFMTHFSRYYQSGDIRLALRLQGFGTFLPIFLGGILSYNTSFLPAVTYCGFTIFVKAYANTTYKYRLESKFERIIESNGIPYYFEYRAKLTYDNERYTYLVRTTTALSYLIFFFMLPHMALVRLFIWVNRFSRITVALVWIICIYCYLPSVKADDGHVDLPKQKLLMHHVLPHRDIFFWNSLYTDVIQFIVDKFFLFVSWNGLLFEVPALDQDVYVHIIALVGYIIIPFFFLKFTIKYFYNNILVILYPRFCAKLENYIYQHPRLFLRLEEDEYAVWYMHKYVNAPSTDLTMARHWYSYMYRRELEFFLVANMFLLFYLCPLFRIQDKKAYLNNIIKTNKNGTARIEGLNSPYEVEFQLFKRRIFFNSFFNYLAIDPNTQDLIRFLEELRASDSTSFTQTWAGFRRANTLRTHRLYASHMAYERLVRANAILYFQEALYQSFYEPLYYQYGTLTNPTQIREVTQRFYQNYFSHEFPNAVFRPILNSYSRRFITAPRKNPDIIAARDLIGAAIIEREFFKRKYEISRLGMQRMSDLLNYKQELERSLYLASYDEDDIFDAHYNDRILYPDLFDDPIFFKFDLDNFKRYFLQDTMNPVFSKYRSTLKGVLLKNYAFGGREILDLYQTYPLYYKYYHYAILKKLSLLRLGGIYYSELTPYSYFNENLPLVTIGKYPFRLYRSNLMYPFLRRFIIQYRRPKNRGQRIVIFQRRFPWFDFSFKPKHFFMDARKQVFSSSFSEYVRNRSDMIYWKKRLEKYNFLSRRTHLRLKSPYKSLYKIRKRDRRRLKKYGFNLPFWDPLYIPMRDLVSSIDAQIDAHVPFASFWRKKKFSRYVPVAKFDTLESLVSHITTLKHKRDGMLILLDNNYIKAPKFAKVRSRRRIHKNYFYPHITHHFFNARYFDDIDYDDEDSTDEEAFTDYTLLNPEIFDYYTFLDYCGLSDLEDTIAFDLEDDDETEEEIADLKNYLVLNKRRILDSLNDYESFNDELAFKKVSWWLAKNSIEKFQRFDDEFNFFSEEESDYETVPGLFFKHFKQIESDDDEDLDEKYIVKGEEFLDLEHPTNLTFKEFTQLNPIFSRVLLADNYFYNFVKLFEPPLKQLKSRFKYGFGRGLPILRHNSDYFLKPVLTTLQRKAFLTNFDLFTLRLLSKDLIDSELRAILTNDNDLKNTLLSLSTREDTHADSLAHTNLKQIFNLPENIEPTTDLFFNLSDATDFLPLVQYCVDNNLEKFLTEKLFFFYNGFKVTVPRIIDLPDYLRFFPEYQKLMFFQKLKSLFSLKNSTHRLGTNLVYHDDFWFFFYLVNKKKFSKLSKRLDLRYRMSPIDYFTLSADLEPSLYSEPEEPKESDLDTVQSYIVPTLDTFMLYDDDSIFEGEIDSEEFDEPEWWEDNIYNTPRREYPILKINGQHFPYLSLATFTQPFGIVDFDKVYTLTDLEKQDLDAYTPFVGDSRRLSGELIFNLEHMPDDFSFDEYADNLLTWLHFFAFKDRRNYRHKIHYRNRSIKYSRLVDEDGKYDIEYDILPYNPFNIDRAGVLRVRPYLHTNINYTRNPIDTEDVLRSINRYNKFLVYQRSYRDLRWKRRYALRKWRLLKLTHDGISHPFLFRRLNSLYRQEIDYYLFKNSIQRWGLRDNFYHFDLMGHAYEPKTNLLFLIRQLTPFLSFYSNQGLYSNIDVLKDSSLSSKYNLIKRIKNTLFNYLGFLVRNKLYRPMGKVKKRFTRPNPQGVKYLLQEHEQYLKEQKIKRSALAEKVMLKKLLEKKIAVKKGLVKKKTAVVKPTLQDEGFYYDLFLTRQLVRALMPHPYLYNFWARYPTQESSWTKLDISKTMRFGSVRRRRGKSFLQEIILPKNKRKKLPPIAVYQLDRDLTRYLLRRQLLTAAYVFNTGQKALQEFLFNHFNVNNHFSNYLRYWELIHKHARSEVYPPLMPVIQWSRYWPSIKDRSLEAYFKSADIFFILKQQAFLNDLFLKLKNQEVPAFAYDLNSILMCFSPYGDSLHRWTKKRRLDFNYTLSLPKVNSSPADFREISLYIPLMQSLIWQWPYHRAILAVEREPTVKRPLKFTLPETFTMRYRPSLNGFYRQGRRPIFWEPIKLNTKDLRNPFQLWIITRPEEPAFLYDQLLYKIAGLDVVYLNSDKYFNFKYDRFYQLAQRQRQEIPDYDWVFNSYELGLATDKLQVRDKHWVPFYKRFNHLMLNFGHYYKSSRLVGSTQSKIPDMTLSFLLDSTFASLFNMPNVIPVYRDDRFKYAGSLPKRKKILKQPLKLTADLMRFPTLYKENIFNPTTDNYIATFENFLQHFCDHFSSNDIFFIGPSFAPYTIRYVLLDSVNAAPRKQKVVLYTPLKHVLNPVLIDYHNVLTNLAKQEGVKNLNNYNHYNETYNYIHNLFLQIAQEDMIREKWFNIRPFYKLDSRVLQHLAYQNLTYDRVKLLQRLLKYLEVSPFSKAREFPKFTSLEKLIYRLGTPVFNPHKFYNNRESVYRKLPDRNKKNKKLKLRDTKGLIYIRKMKIKEWPDFKKNEMPLRARQMAIKVKSQDIESGYKYFYNQLVDLLPLGNFFENLDNNIMPPIRKLSSDLENYTKFIQERKIRHFGRLGDQFNLNNQGEIKMAPAFFKRRNISVINESLHHPDWYIYNDVYTQIFNQLTSPASLIKNIQHELHLTVKKNLLPNYYFLLNTKSVPGDVTMRTLLKNVDSLILHYLNRYYTVVKDPFDTKKDRINYLHYHLSKKKSYSQPVVRSHEIFLPAPSIFYYRKYNKLANYLLIPNSAPLSLSFTNNFYPFYLSKNQISPYLGFFKRKLFNPWYSFVKESESDSDLWVDEDLYEYAQDLFFNQAEYEADLIDAQMDEDALNELIFEPEMGSVKRKWHDERTTLRPVEDETEEMFFRYYNRVQPKNAYRLPDYLFDEEDFHHIFMNATYAPNNYFFEENPFCQMILNPGYYRYFLDKNYGFANRATSATKLVRYSLLPNLKFNAAPNLIDATALDFFKRWHSIPVGPRYVRPIHKYFSPDFDLSIIRQIYFLINHPVENYKAWKKLTNSYNPESVLPGYWFVPRFNFVKYNRNYTDYPRYYEIPVFVHEVTRRANMPSSTAYLIDNSKAIPFSTSYIDECLDYIEDDMPNTSQLYVYYPFATSVPYDVFSYLFPSTSNWRAGNIGFNMLSENFMFLVKPINSIFSSHYGDLLVENIDAIQELHDEEDLRINLKILAHIKKDYKILLSEYKKEVLNDKAFNKENQTFQTFDPKQFVLNQKDENFFYYTAALTLLSDPERWGLKTRAEELLCADLIDDWLAPAEEEKNRYKYYFEYNLLDKNEQLNYFFVNAFPFFSKTRVLPLNFFFSKDFLGQTFFLELSHSHLGNYFLKTKPDYVLINYLRKNISNQKFHDMLLFDFIHPYINERVNARPQQVSSVLKKSFDPLWTNNFYRLREFRPGDKRMFIPGDLAIHRRILKRIANYNVYAPMLNLSYEDNLLSYVSFFLYSKFHNAVSNLLTTTDYTAFCNYFSKNVLSSQVFSAVQRTYLNSLFVKITPKSFVKRNDAFAELLVFLYQFDKNLLQKVESLFNNFYSKKVANQLIQKYLLNANADIKLLVPFKQNIFLPNNFSTLRNDIFFKQVITLLSRHLAYSDAVQYTRIIISFLAKKGFLKADYYSFEQFVFAFFKQITEQVSALSIPPLPADKQGHFLSKLFVAKFLENYKSHYLNLISRYNGEQDLKNLMRPLNLNPLWDSSNYNQFATPFILKRSKFPYTRKALNNQGLYYYHDKLYDYLKPISEVFFDPAPNYSTNVLSLPKFKHYLLNLLLINRSQRDYYNKELLLLTNLFIHAFANNDFDSAILPFLQGSVFAHKKPDLVTLSDFNNLKFQQKMTQTYIDNFFKVLVFTRLNSASIPQFHYLPDLINLRFLKSNENTFYPLSFLLLEVANLMRDNAVTNLLFDLDTKRLLQRLFLMSMHSDESFLYKYNNSSNFYILNKIRERLIPTLYNQKAISDVFWQSRRFMRYPYFKRQGKTIYLEHLNTLYYNEPFFNYFNGIRNSDFLRKTSILVPSDNFSFFQIPLVVLNSTLNSDFHHSLFYSQRFPNYPRYYRTPEAKIRFVNRFFLNVSSHIWFWLDRPISYTFYKLNKALDNLLCYWVSSDKLILRPIQNKFDNLLLNRYLMTLPYISFMAPRDVDFLFTSLPPFLRLFENTNAYDYYYSFLSPQFFYPYLQVTHKKNFFMQLQEFNVNQNSFYNFFNEAQLRALNKQRLLFLLTNYASSKTLALHYLKKLKTIDYLNNQQNYKNMQNHDLLRAYTISIIKSKKLRQLHNFMVLNQLHNNLYSLAQPYNTSFIFNKSIFDLAFLNEKIHILLNNFFYKNTVTRKPYFASLQEFTNFIKTNKKNIISKNSALADTNDNLHEKLFTQALFNPKPLGLTDKINNVFLLPNSKLSNYQQALRDNAFYNGQYINNFIHEDKLFKTSFYKNTTFLPYQYTDVLSKRASFFKNNWLPRDNRLQKLIKRRLNLNFLNKPSFGPRPYKWSWLDELRAMVGLTTPRRLRRQELLSVRQLSSYELEQVGFGYLSDYYPLLRLWYYTTEPHEYQTLVADYAFETNIKAIYYYDLKMLYVDFSELPFLGNYSIYTIETKLYNHFWAFSYFLQMPFTLVMFAYTLLIFLIILSLRYGAFVIDFLKKMFLKTRLFVLNCWAQIRFYTPTIITFVTSKISFITNCILLVKQFAINFEVTKTRQGRLALLKDTFFLPILNFLYPYYLRFLKTKVFFQFKLLFKVVSELELLEELKDRFYGFFRPFQQTPFYSKILHFYTSFKHNVIFGYSTILLNTFYAGISMPVTFKQIKSYFVTSCTFVLAFLLCQIVAFFDSFIQLSLNNFIFKKIKLVFNQYAILIYIICIPLFFTWLLS